MGTKGIARQVTTYIHRLYKEGQGTLGEAERRMGLGQSYLSQMRRAGDAKLSLISRCAEDLGLPLDELCRRALGRRDLQPTGRPPRIVDLALEASGAGLTEHLLESLEKQKHAHPMAVLDTLMTLALQASPAQSSKILIMAASCFGKIFRFNDALWCLESVKERSGLTGAERSLRAGLLFFRLGEIDLARQCENDALVLFAQERHLGGIGEALAASAASHHAGGDTTQAMRLCKSALLYNQNMRPAFVGSCWQGLALEAFRRQDVANGRLNIEHALEQFERAGNPESVAKALWLSAAAEGDPADAAHRLEDVLAIFPRHCAIDIALVTVDLAELYLTLERSSDALDVARRAFSLIDDLKFLPDARKAVTELVVASTRGRLEQLDRIKLELLNNRAKLATLRPEN